VTVVGYIDQQTGDRVRLDPTVKYRDEIKERKVLAAAAEELDTDSLNRVH
jgi:hypothetical protein